MDAFQRDVAVRLGLLLSQHDCDKWTNVAYGWTWRCQSATNMQSRKLGFMKHWGDGHLRKVRLI